MPMLCPIPLYKHRNPDTEPESKEHSDAGWKAIYWRRWNVLFYLIIFAFRWMAWAWVTIMMKWRRRRKRNNWPENNTSISVFICYRCIKNQKNDQLVWWFGWWSTTWVLYVKHTISSKVITLCSIFKRESLAKNAHCDNYCTHTKGKRSSDGRSWLPRAVWNGLLRRICNWGGWC